MRQYRSRDAPGQHKKRLSVAPSGVYAVRPHDSSRAGCIVAAVTLPDGNSRSELLFGGAKSHVGDTWHQFRHIHYSLLNDLKAPVKIAQEQLGHESVSTTLNLYTHVVEASHRKAVEEVEERLFGKTDCSALKSAAGAETAPAAG
jgi:hypothetical protein